KENARQPAGLAEISAAGERQRPYCLRRRVRLRPFFRFPERGDGAPGGASGACATGALETSLAIGPSARLARAREPHCWGPAPPGAPPRMALSAARSRLRPLTSLDDALG